MPDADYVELLAEVYDRFWGPYPRRIGAQMLRLHAAMAPVAERRVLDIGCGTGLVAERFLDEGFTVTGVDRSPGMLRFARSRLGDKAILLEADASDFANELGESDFPFVISTYDIVNAMGDVSRVRAYFECVHRSLAHGGVFAFDLATWKGLRTMHGIQVRDEDEALLVIRGALSEEERIGFLRISGAVRASDGRHDRFATTLSNRAYDVVEMLGLVREAGFELEHVSGTEDVLTPTEDPEDLTRVVIVARKPVPDS